MLNPPLSREYLMDETAELPVRVHAAPTPGERPDEYELVQLLSRTKLEGFHALQAKAIVQGNLRWGYVQSLALYHGTLPLVYAHLRRWPDEVPDKLLAALRDQVNALAARSLFLTQDLGTLARLFAAEGVDVLTIKGAPLALQVYGSLALRPFVDIDLVVPAHAFKEVERHLIRQGYQQESLDPFRKALYLHIHKQYTFWKAKSLGASHSFSALDVHTGVMPPGYSYRERFEDLWARARPLRVGNGVVQTLAREDLVLVLAYHGFKNRWDRLKYVADIAETLRAETELDWDVLFRRAEADGGRRVLYLALALAEELADAELPLDVKRTIGADAKVVAVARPVVDRLPRQAHIAVETLRERMQLNLIAQDRLAGRARYAAYVAARRLSEAVLPS